MEYLQQLNPLWHLFSFLGDSAFLLVFFSLLFLWAAYYKKPYLKATYDTLILLAVGIALSYILKVVIGRARPLYLEHNIGPLFAPFNLNNSFHSFPSSHSLSAAIVAFSNIKKRPLSYLFIGLVSISRVMLLKHHVTDVLGAVAIAYFIVYQLDKTYLFSFLKKIAYKVLYTK
jgi:membrane-associated phospholipid phosphatase